MQRLSVALIVLLFAVAFAAGQAPGNPKFVPSPAASNLTKAQTLSNPANSGCPIGFFASRQASTQMMLAGDSSIAGPVQGLHITLNPINTPAIDSVEVTLYGISPNARVLPVEIPSSDIVTKTFQLSRNPGTASLKEADVWMHKVGVLRWVDLISITYADGTNWHATENFKCRAVPSNFLLIGSN